eukprot:scaffold27703_cov115-Isochrysis_galbana.AAC.1
MSGCRWELGDGIGAQFIPAGAWRVATVADGHVRQTSALLEAGGRGTRVPGVMKGGGGRRAVYYSSWRVATVADCHVGAVGGAGARIRSVVSGWPRGWRPVEAPATPLAQWRLNGKWQVPETGHGPHRRDFRVFDKFVQTSQQTSTLCSSGFLEPRTSKIYLLAGPLAQKGHWQVPETGHGPHRRSFQDLPQICMSPAQTSTLSSFIRLLEHRTSKIYVLAVATVLPNHMLTGCALCTPILG